MMSTRCIPKVRQLKSQVCWNTLDVRVSQAVDQQSWPPLEFLALLLDDELERRSPTTSGMDPLPYSGLR